jgi:bifunctional non-homologous end joining protein LigD
MSDEQFLDMLAAESFTHMELAFVHDFPWKKPRCAAFGKLAAERDIGLSVHAPFFAMLTVEDEERAKKCVHAIEHSMKLSQAMGGTITVVHPGHARDKTSEEIFDLVRERLDYLASKTHHLSQHLGLEVSGTVGAFGSLGDIAVMANEYPFVYPVVDWAHVHAVTQGQMTNRESFEAVINFLYSEFPNFKTEHLHTHFSDNHFGPGGEIKHVPYGEGTLRATPLAETIASMNLDITVISESHQMDSHRQILAELNEGLESAPSTPATNTRPLSELELPNPISVMVDGEAFVPIGVRQPLRLSNVDKPLFGSTDAEGTGYTKGDLIQFYASISQHLLPHIADRPLTMVRFPNGIDDKHFYEKRSPSHAPDWINTQVMGDGIEYITANDRATLMWLANMACIEVHPTLHRGDDSQADIALFDIDPQEGASWADLAEAAGLLKLLLDNLGLRGYPKTSGSRGLHIHVPLAPGHSFERSRGFIAAVGGLLAKANPDGISIEFDKAKRKGKVYIDIGQNGPRRTTAGVYSVRPRPGAPVSTPLRWEEIGDIDPMQFTIETIWDRLAEHGDLFAPASRDGQDLAQAEEALGIT